MKELENFKTQPLSDQDSKSLLIKYKTDCTGRRVGKIESLADTDTESDFSNQGAEKDIQHLISLIRGGQYMQALYKITKTLTSSSLHPVQESHYLALKAEALRISGDTEKALLSVNKSLKRVPNQVSGYYIKGLCLMGQEKWGDAVDEFHKAIWTESSYLPHINACVALCHLYSSTQLEMALSHAKIAHELNPSDSFCLFVLGRVYDAVGSFHNAALVYQLLGKLNGEFFDNYEQMANRAKKDGKWEIANEMYLDLLKMKPKDINVFNRWKETLRET